MTATHARLSSRSAIILLAGPSSQISFRTAVLEGVGCTISIFALRANWGGPRALFDSKSKQFESVSRSARFSNSAEFCAAHRCTQCIAHSRSDRLRRLHCCHCVVDETRFCVSTVAWPVQPLNAAVLRERVRVQQSRMTNCQSEHVRNKNSHIVPRRQLP